MPSETFGRLFFYGLNEEKKKNLSNIECEYVFNKLC